MATDIFLWVTLLTPEVADILTSGLIREGLNVGPLSRAKVLSREGKHSTQCSILLRDVEDRKEGENPEAVHVVLDAAKKILEPYCYFTMICAARTQATWESEHFPEVAPAPTNAPDKIAEDTVILEDED